MSEQLCSNVPFLELPSTTQQPLLLSLIINELHIIKYMCMYLVFKKCKVYSSPPPNRKKLIVIIEMDKCCQSENQTFFFSLPLPLESQLSIYQHIFSKDQMFSAILTNRCGFTALPMQAISSAWASARERKLINTENSLHKRALQKTLWKIV